MVPIYVEHWGDNLQFYPNFVLFPTPREIKFDNDFFHVSNLSENQKKGFHQKSKRFCSQNQVKAKKKKVQKSFRAEMQTGRIDPPPGFRHPCSSGTAAKAQLQN